MFGLMKRYCLKCFKECSFLSATEGAGKIICLECWDTGSVDISMLEQVVTPILENRAPTTNERILGEAVLALLIVIRKMK